MKAPDFILELLKRPQCDAICYPWVWSNCGYYCTRPAGHGGQHRDWMGSEFGESFDRRSRETARANGGPVIFGRDGKRTTPGKDTSHG